MGGPFSNSSDSKLPQFSSSASMDNLSLLGRYSYYHDNIDLAESPLLRCLRVGSPDSFRYQALSLAENLEVARSPTIYGTPVKVEEDVLVMDEISVNSALPTGRFARSFTDSGGSTTSSSSSSSGGKTLYKTEICRSWEDSGTCRYGPKCQFAHGKDELRPSRFPGKNKIETYKSYSGTGSGTYGPKSRFLYQVIPAVGSQAARVTPQTVSPSNPEESRKNPVSYSAGSDWSPQDDGIEVLLPHSSPENLPSREEVDAYLETILYAPTTKKRLPVFAEICLE